MSSSKIIVSVLLLAISWGCDAIGYRYNTNCIRKQCEEDSGWQFSLAKCGCVKDGDRSALLPNQYGGNPFPFLGRPGSIFFQRPNDPIFIQNQDPRIFFQQGGQRPFVVPSNPQSIFVQQSPNGPIVIPNPSQPQIITQPTGQQPSIIQFPQQPFPNPRCPRNFVCRTPNQFFDENQCRCVCAVQHSCSPGQTFDNSQCQCVCRSGINSCPRSFQIFNPSTCRCDPQTCPNRCTQCERQDPDTCACQPIVGFCPFGQVLNPSTCQCSCNNFIQCNNNQRLNPRSCECQCTSYTVTITEQFPGDPGPPIAVPGPVISTGGTRRTGTTRTGTRRGTRRGRGAERKRRNAEAEEVDDAAIEGPEVEEVLFREKRRRTRRPGPSTPRTRTRIIVSQPPSFIPGPPGPPISQSRTFQVGVCPGGTNQDNFSCTCN